MDSQLLNTPIAKIMTREVLTLAPNDIMEKAQSLFQENAIHHLPVIDHANQPIGIISSRDLDKVLHGFTLFKTQQSEAYNHSILKALLVRDVMTKPVAKILETNPLKMAADIFRENFFHALPVVHKDGTLVGILTTYDLLNYAYQAPPAAAME